MFRALRRNLAVGLRAAILLRVRLADLVLDSTQVVLLCLLLLALEVASGLVRTGLNAAFTASELPHALAYVPLLLFAGWVIAHRTGEPALLAGVAVLHCSVTLPYAVAYDVLAVTSDAGWLAGNGGEGGLDWLWPALYGLWAAAIVVGVARLVGGPWLQRLASAATMTGFVLVPLYLLPNAALWTARESDAQQGDHDWYALAREEIFYAQPALLERALAALRPERKGVRDLYFIGVAGDASQDVFMKELRVIGELFRSRFDTEGRMVTLVNNPKTAGALPVATATSLARTLKQMGKVMNRDEDVLFLYLTSHGSEEHRLSMQFWPLELNDIDPAMLKQMLDVAHIKWRVLAVSACYSGGFVEPLKDEDTMIVTAADARRSSFGCGAESDFTYFGKAYFDEALRATYSFTDAFATARTAIAARERAEQLAPSNPQIFVGSAIRSQLDALTERLRARPRSPFEEEGRDGG